MWKIKILTAFSSLSLLIYSCGSVATSTEAVYTVKIQLEDHHPYCGGAYPTPEQERGYYTPISNQKYYLLQDVAESSKRVEVYLNAEGEADTELTKGCYLIYHADKLLRFEEFYAKRNLTYELTKNEDEACYRKWYETADFKFEVVSDTSLRFIYQGRCFVGVNPCLNYEGPMPP